MAANVLAPGELPLGLYVAQARLDPGAGYFRTVTAAVTALVVNTDLGQGLGERALTWARPRGRPREARS